MLSGGRPTLALKRHHTQQGVLLYPPGLAIGIPAHNLVKGR